MLETKTSVTIQMLLDLETQCGIDVYSELEKLIDFEIKTMAKYKREERERKINRIFKK